MSAHSPQPVLSERVYGWLLRLMPRDFDDHRQDALETFRDLQREARVRGRVARLLLVVGLGLQAVQAGLVARCRPLAKHPSLARRRGAWWRALRDDSRLARRSLVRRPAFALTVVGVLALGIGAATTVFSVVDCVLLRPMPYPEAERLVFFDHGSHPGPAFERWQQEARAFSLLGAGTDDLRDLTGDGPPREVAIGLVSADFFGLFGAGLRLGRLLDREDFVPGARQAVLGHGLWQRRWGSDPAIVGRTITLEGEVWTVVGVMAPDFVPPETVVGSRVDVWLPLDFSTEDLTSWSNWSLGVVGRLGPSTDLASAQAEMDVFARRFAEEQPDARRTREGEPRMIPLVPLREATVGPVRSALFMLFGAVVLMLLVGCVNVASLFLARGTERGREMALRLALGARPRRVAAQLLAESVSLSLLGGACGAALAFGLTRAFRASVPGDLPRVGEITVDGRVLAVAVVAALVTGVLFGLAPAWQAARARVEGALSNTASATTSGRRTSRARGALVVAEVAMALILLSGAGLLGHSLVRLMRVDLGFEPERVTRLQVRLGERYTEESRLQLTRELLTRVEALPGVSATALGWSVPFDYVGNHRCCWRSRFTAEPEAEPTRAFVHPVSPGYFHTLGARLLAGREIGWQDTTATPVPVVLNQHMAEQLFGEHGAVGQSLTMGDETLVIAGVVADVKRWGGAAESDGEVYVPYFRYGSEEEDVRLVARTASAATPGLADALRDIVWDLDPSLPVGEVVTLEQRVSGSLAEARFLALLLASFAGLALLLAAVGLCGALLYAVNQRQRELGIRLAVGARQGDLLRLVLGRGLALALAGLAIGLAGALALSRVLTSMVFGITATDPTTYLGVSLLLFVVAAAASYLPARRAAKTDPIETLRAD